MAGDHKCPVCNSTFTRPQHVARHMRSHTGDRPYKCQHCGDQFARSDLLSRHVNKCHAAEKPPTTTAPNNRRKGTAAASRATTSKQACDQCVQSSLPCDGCNPCSKCVSRKCRCTYVKFHRQTAPSGPGHPPAHSLQHHPRGAYIGAGYPEDFMLAGPGSQASMNGLYMPNDYALPPTSALYNTHPHAYTDPRDPSLVLSRDALEMSPELLARYRQAELLGRAGVMSNAAALNSTQPSVVQGLYGADHQHLGRYDLSSSQTQAWAHAGHGHSFQDDGHKAVDGFAPGADRSFPGGGGNTALSGHSTAHGAPFSSLPGTSQSGAAAAGPYANDGISFPQHHLQHSGHASGPDGRRHSEELSDDFGSDSAHSVPSSANSSSVHLPLMDQRGRPYSGSPTAPYQQSNLSGHGSGEHRKEEVGEGGFSSAFGLMSLDDPAVLAGLANDPAPFFSAIGGYPHTGSEGNSAPHSTNSSNTSLTSASTSQSHQSSHGGHSSSAGLSLATPTPELLASLKGNLFSAGGREALESKELRDFWKQYMRTPLTGPGSGSQVLNSMFPLQTPTGPGQQLGRPSPTRRHSRVNSLPSMKTPPIMNQDFSTFAPGGDFAKPKDRSSEDGHRDERHGYTQGYSNVRTTLHGNVEDLKSYEQAVLARKAPTQLKLQPPKRRGTMPAGTAVPHLGGFGQLQPPPVPSLSHATHMHPSDHSGGIPMHRDDQRSGSASSSLADAFGSSPVASQQGESPREGSVGTESSDGGASVAVRPSFKRLASQTLGPENSKRALLGPAGWDDEDALEEEDELDDEDGQWGQRRRYTVAGGGGEGGPRRFSLPSGAGIASGGSTLPPIKSQFAPSPSPVGAYPQ